MPQGEPAYFRGKAMSGLSWRGGVTLVDILGNRDGEPPMTHAELQAFLRGIVKSVGMCLGLDLQCDRMIALDSRDWPSKECCDQAMNQVCNCCLKKVK
jgi:hypothetical protein